MDFLLSPKVILMIAWGLLGMVGARDVGKRYGWGAAGLLYGIYLGVSPVWHI